MSTHFSVWLPPKASAHVGGDYGPTAVDASIMARPIKHGKQWRIRWFDADHVRQSATFGDYNVAAHELRKREVEAEEVRRGTRQSPPPDRTMGDIFDHWVKHRAPEKKSGSDDESIIRAHLRPAFDKIKLSEFNQTDVDAYRAARSTLNVKTIRNHLSVLVGCLKLAHDAHWLVRVPRIRIPKAVNSGAYRYLRDNSEVERFLDAAAREEDPVVGILYRTAAFTGLRAGELAGLRWRHVDFEHNQIHVELSFDEGTTKSGKVRHVPLLAPLKVALEAWRERNPLDIVFPSQAGKELAPSGRVFQEVLHRVLKRAGFPTRLTRNGKERGYIVFHDLRHTFASHWVMKGGDLYKLQRILGHESPEMTQRYAHLDANAFAKDLSRFDELGAA